MKLEGWAADYAAYLHDLGYAPSLALTGLHALDGARHLRAIGQSGWLAWWPTTPAPEGRPNCAA